MCFKLLGLLKHSLLTWLGGILLHLVGIVHLIWLLDSVSLLNIWELARELAWWAHPVDSLLLHLEEQAGYVVVVMQCGLVPVV